MRTLEINRIDELSSLQKVASFATLVATYDKGEISGTLAAQSAAYNGLLPGFLLILEPFESDMATVPNPIFHLT